MAKQIRIEVESERTQRAIRDEAKKQGKRIPRMAEEIFWAGLSVIKSKKFLPKS